MGRHSNAKQEKVELTGITRRAGFLYYVKGSDVYEVRLYRPDQPSPRGQAKVIARGSFTRDNAYLYFVDKDGDVARSKRVVGATPGHRGVRW